MPHIFEKIIPLRNNGLIRICNYLPHHSVKSAAASLSSIVDHPENVRGEINFWHAYHGLKKLEQINLNNPNHTKDSLVHSITAFHNALKLSSDISFLDNFRAKMAYSDFFASKLDGKSSFTMRDLVAIAALFHDIGTGMTYKNDAGIDVPIARMDHEKGFMTAKGHEKIGADAAYKMSLKLGLSEKEADYIAFLVRFHMAAGGIKNTFEDSMIIGYLKLINFDLGAPFLVLCDQMALDVKNEQKENLIKYIMEYQFFIKPLLTTVSHRSMFEQLKMVSPVHKKIFIPFDGDIDGFIDFLRIDHLQYLDEKADKIEKEIKELEIYDESLHADHNEIKREMDSIINNPIVFRSRALRLTRHVQLIPVDEYWMVRQNYDYRNFKNEIPVQLYKHSFFLKNDGD